jgi:protein-tyrosine phosphatase
MCVCVCVCICVCVYVCMCVSACERERLCERPPTPHQASQHHTELQREERKGTRVGE